MDLLAAKSRCASIAHLMVCSNPMVHKNFLIPVGELSVSFFAKETAMRYRLKTFRVQLLSEPAEFTTGSPCRSLRSSRPGRIRSLLLPR